MRRLFFAALCMALLPSLTIAQIVPDAAGSFDFVDDFLSPSGGPNQSVPGTYDIFGFTGTGTASTGPDGRADFSIKTTSFGLGTDGNNVSWDASIGVSGTGLVSTIDPSFIKSGGVTSNNGGHLVGHALEINFLDGIFVTADHLSNFGASSSNTAGIVWEYSALQLLDVNGNAFTNFNGFGPGAYNTQAAGTPTDGLLGPGTILSDGTGNVTQVGSDLAVAGSNGVLNGTAGGDGVIDFGVAAGTQLGGVRLLHFIEDTRGINNGDTIFTNTINDLDINLKVVPEPSSALILLVSGAGLLVRRRRR